MYSIKTLIVGAVIQSIFLLVSGASINGTESKNATESNSNSTESDSLDDRFNLNLNLAGAHGVGPNGKFSQSNAYSYGLNAGIRGPGGQYQNLYSNSGSKSHGYSSGPGAPLTFANTASRYRPGYAGGNASAGIHGGRGNAYAQSINQNIEIPLDNHGTVLLSNLNVPSSNSTNSTEETTTATADKEKAKDAIIFS